MHLLFLASVFLSLSAYAAADWVTYAQYKEYDTCATSSQRGSVYILNTCIPGYVSSYYYNYSASVNSSLLIRQRYSTTDCTGEISYSNTDIFGQCDFGDIATYSATQPQITGHVFATYATDDSTCANYPPSFDYYNFGTCISGTKYSYYGGGACISQTYNNSDCTGPITNGYATSGVSCYGRYGSYCSLNGVTLPEQRAAPTVTPGSNYIAYRSYSKSNCTGTASGVFYRFASGCDGQGTVSSYGATSFTQTAYDNANCTGYQISTTTTSYDSNTPYSSNIGQCQSSSAQSYISTLEPLPSGSFVTIGAITVDNCQNPTQTYAAAIYTNGCVQDNSTSSSKISCVVSGANTTFTSTIYNSVDCSGPVAATEVSNVYSCAVSQYNPYESIKYLCNAALPKTSDATTTSRSNVMYVAVMMIAAVAYVL